MNKIHKVKIVIFLVLFLFSVLIFFIFKNGKENISFNTPLSDKTLRDNAYSDEQFGTFLGQTVAVADLISFMPDRKVLGEESPANKKIGVNLAAQKVIAYENNSPVMEFIVSTGKWYRTPAGAFTIQRKIRAQKMSGGSREKGTYYYLPNVPWVMFFGNSKIPWYRGFAFHGAYWHNNFGQPMSHGCINMKIPDSEALYSWAPIGTEVIIY